MTHELEPMLYWQGINSMPEVIAFITRDFEAEGALDNATVHYAEYDCPSYSGYAVVVFERDGKLFEVHGSHCSCFGLEDQWGPEETTWEAIAMRPNPLGAYAKQKISG